MDIFLVGMRIRTELLEYKDKWKFTGNLTTGYKKTPRLSFLLQTILFGKHGQNSKRIDEISRTVEDLGQILLQNVATDRQVKHKPVKADTSFHHNVELPLPIALPLSIYQRTRQECMVRFIHDMHLGVNIDFLREFSSRIHNGVVSRMKKTGNFYIPDFMVRGKQVIFAIDNIDFVEDTAFGQNSTHATVIVASQEEDDKAEKINPALKIPKKSSVEIDVEYRKINEVYPKPIRFNQVQINDEEQYKYLLGNYVQYHRAWAFSCHMSNTTTDVDEVPRNGEEVNLSADYEGHIHTTSAEVLEHPMPLSEHVTPAEVSEHPTPLSEHITSATVSEQPTPLEETGSVIKSSVVVSKRKKHKKRDCMPTWAATKSLILADIGHVPRKMKSEVMAPLLLRSPTDMSTLYTALKHTQNVSAYVCGSDRKTIITLDMDLYERAMKLKSHFSEQNWLLRPGELHYCFALLHALGKNIEGSGFDTCAIEACIYSPASLRQIYTNPSRSFTGGIEHHLTMSLLFLNMKFEAALNDESADDNPGPLEIKDLRDVCNSLRDALHERDNGVSDKYEVVKKISSDYIWPKFDNIGEGELSSYIDKYLLQVEALMNIIATCRSGDFDGYIAAAENAIKYLFAFDLHHYSRLMPVHIQEMKEVRSTNPELWKELSSGFSINKTGIPFCNLFNDQNLEQHIKKLKDSGCLLGLTQSPQSLQKLMFTAPQLGKIVEEFRGKNVKTRTEHYQLSGDAAPRLFDNMAKLNKLVKLYCSGNPFINKFPLQNIVSSAEIPEDAKKQILNFDVLGEELYKSFVENRLTLTSKMSVWDRINLAKIKTMNTWMKKIQVRIDDKVIKLREERQLLARFLIIQQTRDLDLQNAIGNFEMSLIPRALFNNDCSLLIPANKSIVISLIQELPTVTEIETENQTENSENTPPILEEDEVGSCITMEVEHQNSESWIDTVEYPDDRANVVIIDAMAVVQSIKKTPNMKKMSDFRDVFCTKIQRRAKNYTETRVVFDEYYENSLKEKTRAKRATGKKQIHYRVNENMTLAAVSLKELLSSTKTKQSLTKFLADGLLDAFTGSLIVVQGGLARSHNCVISPEVATHSHEEADTVIPLHVIDTLRSGSAKNVDVHCGDTDIIILLMDLVANDRQSNGQIFVEKTGNFSGTKRIDIIERVAAIGKEKAKGLVGFHNFTGADWGGKFVGITKETWMKAYLEIPEDDDVISCFQLLGSLPLSVENFDGSLPSGIAPIEKFLCSLYAPSDCPERKIPELRYQLFLKKNLEGEKLPPTLPALYLHILRSNFVAARDKSYVTAHPTLPELTASGWDKVGEKFVPLRCLSPPAPKAVLELVKCGCDPTKGDCKGNCSCYKNKLPCTPLCKCYSSGCKNFVAVTYSRKSEEVEEENDEFF